MVKMMRSEETTLKACVLVRVRPGQHYEVAKRISVFEGIKAAFAVMGAADVVARVEVRNTAGLTALASQIGNLPDVVTTETLVAAGE